MPEDFIQDLGDGINAEIIIAEFISNNMEEEAESYYTSVAYEDDSAYIFNKFNNKKTGERKLCGSVIGSVYESDDEEVLDETDEEDDDDTENAMDNYAEEITMPYLYNQFGINYKVKYLKNGKVAAEYDMSEKN